ncbi:MAG TPA: DUF3761 domain-containing protein [Kofleriaceae bacterium]|nr:DUF3761 domain-containing protein [Kofleriaceae bacterium]
MRSKISALLFVVFAATGVTARADVVCRDGTSSVASGRGACSHHGGVAKKRAERTRAPKRADDVVLEPREQSRTDRIRRRGERSHPIEKRESGSPTAVCRDGKLSYALHHRGACSGHDGVERWLD